MRLNVNSKFQSEQEIERIAQAAFGPLGALVGAQLLPGQVKYRDP
jgi:hypothetical protein